MVSLISSFDLEVMVMNTSTFKYPNFVWIMIVCANKTNIW